MDLICVGRPPFRVLMASCLSSRSPAMPDDLGQSAAIGLIASLLSFELVAAVRSWFEARVARTRGDGTSPRRSEPHQPILLSQAFAIRDHFAQRRLSMNRLRGQYAVLGTSNYGRQLRTAISQARPNTFAAVTATCPACRVSRLKGRAHCLECRRRLLVPVRLARPRRASRGPDAVDEGRRRPGLNPRRDPCFRVPGAGSTPSRADRDRRGCRYPGPASRTRPPRPVAKEGGDPPLSRHLSFGALQRRVAGSS